jgi:DNA mismatch repair protein MutS
MGRDNSLTPMMEQYFRIKKEHPDALLFFRLGDFYEMFYEDAQTASPVLEIALTTRQKVPMCGVPHHSVNSYLARLLRAGFKVAVCEQVEDPKLAKGVVRREIIKVLTPGTAVEIESGEAKEHTFIAALSLDGEGWGLALVDLASGDIRALQGTPAEAKDLADELFKSSPKEVLYPEGSGEALGDLLSGGSMAEAARSPVEDWTFDFPQARHLLLEHFRVESLEGFGLSDKSLAVSAAGALLHYLKKVRRDSLDLVARISYQHPGRALVLDTPTVKNLELVRNLRDGRAKGSLLGVVDFTLTSPGGRLLRSWLLAPLTDVGMIRERLDAVEEGVSRTIPRHELRERLKGIHDLERLTSKISLKAANPRDLVALRKSLERLPGIGRVAAGFSAKLFRDIREGWDDAEDVVGLIARGVLDEPAFLLTEGGIVRDGFDAGLDELREISRSGKVVIAQIEKTERERTGIASLKVKFNRVFGYSIEVTKPNLPLVPPDYVRKQTLAGSERFVTPELKAYEEKVLRAEDEIKAIESRLFLEIRDAVARETARLQKIAASVAALDVLAGLAECASVRGYVRPAVDDGDVIRVEGGRHPVVETTQSEAFIPNDAFLDCRDDQILIITGPNMGGKSTFLRQVALIAILGQMGSFVPARSASLGIVDRIFTRIGAMDFLTVGQSTFMVEMLETANILHNATSRSLILLDEVGRGTSTFDGLSLAWAIAEHLHEKEGLRAKTLFATHYHELTELALTLARIKNYHVSVKERKDEILFLRKIVAGPSDQSYGIHVAKLAGIPREVIDRAREILFNLEKQELDEAGLPRLAYRKRKREDRNQMFLFPEDRKAAVLREFGIEIESLEMDRLSPREALDLLGRLRDRLKSGPKP